MEVARQEKTALDVSAEGEVLEYTVTADEPREYTARVTIGDDDGPIEGGGSYVLNVYINDVVLSPSSRVDVSAGVTRTLLISRPVPLEMDDVLSVRVTGLPADTAINTLTTLRDSTPIRIEEVRGDGTVSVDHNYGGTDELAVMTANGARIEAATVRAYRADDYAAGNRSAEFAVGEATTDVNGRWKSALRLDPGDYTLLVFKQSVIRAKVHDLTVA